MERRQARDLTPLEWSRRFLPGYFGRFGPADFHAVLDADLHNLHLRRGDKRSYIAPRGGAKSTVVTLSYVLRCALEAWEPYTLILSDSSEQANELLRHVKSELTTNEFLADVYPEACGQGPEWKEQRIRLRNGMVIEALGTGKKIRGRRNRSERPSLVVFDDVQSNEDIISPTLRVRAWDWATREVLPAGDERTNFLGVGSALHREAVSVRLGTLAGWHGRTFPALHSWPDRMDLWDEFVRLACNTADPDKTATARAYYERHREEMDAGARTYWPSRWDLPALMTRRAEIGSAAFLGEYQGIPASPDGAEFPAEWFDWDGFWFDDWPTHYVAKAVYLDPSKGMQDDPGDFQAHVCGMLSIVDGRNTLFLDADLQREPIPAMIERGLRMCRVWGGVSVWGVEETGTMGFLKPVVEQKMAEMGFLVPFLPVQHSVPKIQRIRRLAPYLQLHQIKIRNTPGGRMLRLQLGDVPFGEFKDGPDAAAGVVDLLEQLTMGES